jgi:hypothetical protein
VPYQLTRLKIQQSERFSMTITTRSMGPNIRIENLALLGADGALWKVSLKDSRIEFRRTRAFPPWSPSAASPPCGAVGSKTTLSTYLNEKSQRLHDAALRQHGKYRLLSRHWSASLMYGVARMVYCTWHIYAARLVYATVVPSFTAGKLKRLTFPSRILA